MKSLLTFIVSITFIGLLGGLLWSCDKWELPTKKTKRECVKPSGNLVPIAQERKVDFSITNATGTIDKVTWDFGGGTNSTTTTTGLTASYTYPTSNTYTAKATLSNTCGDITILSITVSAADAVAPTVSLQTPTNISTNSAVAGMTVTSTGNATITRYGVCYSSTNQTPTTADATSAIQASIAVNAPASFTLANLQPSTTYYVRSFAINKAGTGYSQSVETFKTGSLPSVSITGTPNVGVNATTVNFVVTNSGNPAAIEYGICYSSTNNMPEVNNSNSTTKQVANPPVNANTSVELTNLTPNTKYYYRSYAKLPSGQIIYSSVSEFTTQVDTLVQDLIASVSFTNGSLKDATVYGNDVTLVDNAGFTADRKGNANSAVQLDGDKDYFFMKPNTILDQTNALSISIWIKPTVVNGRMLIYNKSRFSDGGAAMYSSLIKPNENGIGVTINTDIMQGSNCQPGAINWQTFTFTSNPDLSKWHHVVMTYSGRSSRMYFDNILLDQRDDLGNSIDNCPGSELKFGAQTMSLPQYFKGALDDIRIYKRAITPAEVEALFKQ